MFCLLLIIYSIIKEVISISKEEHSEPIRIFNLNVEDYHTYFVGEEELLVHNEDCSIGKMKAFQEAVEKAKARGITNQDELYEIGKRAVDDAINITKTTGKEYKNYKPSSIL